MFDHTSRYFGIPVAKTTLPDRRAVAYLTRRFVPDRRGGEVLAEVAVIEGDRLDLITARTLGDPLQFWRVADSNDALNPFDLAATPGRRVRVTMPQP